MTPIGWSVGDIIKLVEVSAKVYAAFQDARQNSSRQVQILVDEFTRFHQFLVQLKQLLDKYHKPLLGYEGFKETLKECEEFLKPYSDRLIDRKKSIAKGWATIKFVWEDKDVERLRKQVAGHVQSLQLYINFLTLEAQYEANTSSQYLAVPFPGKQILDPVAPIPYANNGKARLPQRLPTRDQTSLEETEEICEEILRFRHFLQRRLSQPSPSNRSPGGPPERRLTLSNEDREAAVAALSKEIDVALVKAQCLVDEMKEVGSQFDNEPRYTADNGLGIVQTPHGSPEIRISSFSEESWSSIPHGKRPQRSNTYGTVDSGISEMSGRDSFAEPSSSRRESEALFHNPWDGCSEQAPAFSRPESVSATSIFSTSTTSTSSGVSVRSTSFSGPPLTPNETPLQSPVGVLRKSSEGPLLDLRLPAPALEWQVVSKNATLEYTTSEGPRKPMKCEISKRKRHGGGMVIRASLKDPKGYIELECSGLRPPIPHAGSGLRNENETHLTLYADSTCSFNPTQIKIIRFTLFDPAESSNLQSSIYGKTLEFSRNIKIVKSNKHDAECRNVSLRLFSDSGIATLVFFTNTRNEGNGKEKNRWVKEPHTAFERIQDSKITSGSDTLKLEFSKQPNEHADSKTQSTSNASDHFSHSPSLHRAGTGSSAGSASSTASTIMPSNKHKLKWLEIKFKSKEDRRDFVNVWQRFCKPLMGFS